MLGKNIKRNIERAWRRQEEEKLKSSLENTPVNRKCWYCGGKSGLFIVNEVTIGEDGWPMIRGVVVDGDCFNRRANLIMGEPKVEVVEAIMMGLRNKKQ